MLSTEPATETGYYGARMCVRAGQGDAYPPVAYGQESYQRVARINGGTCHHKSAPRPSPLLTNASIVLSLQVMRDRSPTAIPSSTATLLKVQLGNEKMIIRDIKHEGDEEAARKMVEDIQGGSKGICSGTTKLRL